MIQRFIRSVSGLLEDLGDSTSLLLDFHWSFMLDLLVGLCLLGFYYWAAFLACQQKYTMSSNGNPKSFGQQNNSFKTKMEEKKKEKSVNDVMAEAIAGSDSRPRGNWILAKDTASPSAKMPEKMEEKNETSFWGAAAAAVGVAAGVAVVAGGLWMLANYSDPDPEPKNDEKKKNMMKCPGRPPYKMPRDEFEENPKDYFRILRGR